MEELVHYMSKHTVGYQQKYQQQELMIVNLKNQGGMPNNKTLQECCTNLQ